MDDRKLSRFLRNLENLRTFARENHWYERVRADLTLLLGDWAGWLAHATPHSQLSSIQDEGFRSNIKPHSRVGRACYFFPGNCEESRRSAVANAETFYRTFSPCSDQEGVVIEGRWGCSRMLVARGEQWDSANEIFVRLLQILVSDFDASPLPKAQKYFLDDEISRPVAWTLLSDALPDIEAVTIDTDAPSLGDSTFEVLGVFRDCVVEDLCEVMRIAPTYKVSGSEARM